MIREVYRSSRYDERDVKRKYVRAWVCHEGSFRVYEVDGRNKTIREYDTSGEGIPETVREKAISTKDQAFGAALWTE